MASEGHKVIRGDRGDKKITDECERSQEDFRRSSNSSEDHPKTSKYFRELREDFRKVPNIFVNHLKTSEDNRRLPEDLLQLIAKVLIQIHLTYPFLPLRNELFVSLNDIVVRFFRFTITGETEFP